MTNVMKNILALGMAAVLLWNCKDDPTSIGEQLIPDVDKILIFALNSLEEETDQKSKSFKDEGELSFAGRVLLGKHEQTDYTTLAKFSMSLPDSIRSAVDSGKLVINKTWMELPVTYRLGEQSAGYDFKIHEITSTWTAIGFTADSLAVLEYEEENLASNIVEDSDSLITLDFNNDIIMKWIEEIIDDDFRNIPGVIFKPEMSSAKVLGFKAIGSTIPDKAMPTIYSVVEVPGEFIDTLLATPFSDVHVAEGPDIIQNAERMYVQGGNIYRSNILFELSNLPKNITINNAVLRLYLDEGESFLGTSGNDSLLIHSIQDSTTMALDTLSRTRLIRTDNYYEGALTAITQVLLNRDEDHGLNIRLEQELSTASKIALYGSKAADKALRPLLTIIYTKKN